MKNFEIGFLGYGRMAQAISEGLSRSGRIPYQSQAASDLLAGGLKKLAEARSFQPMASNAELVSACRTVVLAVKPRQALALLEEIRPQAEGASFISIVAGLKLAALKAALPGSASVVRVMPNLPALVGRGMTLICAEAPPESLARARLVFEAVGATEELPEAQFDAGMALSGSGPAYFFMVMEAMARGGARLGLSWETARKLTLETALGSAAAALGRPDLHLAALRDQVASPGGTTAEALQVLEKGGLSGLMAEALAAADEKARRLT